MMSAKPYNEVYRAHCQRKQPSPTHFADPKKPERIYQSYRRKRNTSPSRALNQETKTQQRQNTHPHKPKTKVQRFIVLKDHYVIPSDKPIISVDLNTLQQVDVHNGKLLGRTATRGNTTMDKLHLKLDEGMQPLEKYSRMAAYRTILYAEHHSHKHHPEMGRPLSR